MKGIAVLLLAGVCLAQANVYYSNGHQQYYPQAHKPTHYTHQEYTTYKVPLHHYETTTAPPAHHYQHQYTHQTVKPYYENANDYKGLVKKPIVVQPFYVVQKYTTTTPKPTYIPYYTTTHKPYTQHYPSYSQYTNPHLPNYNYHNQHYNNYNTYPTQQSNYNTYPTHHQQTNYQHPTNDYYYHHGTNVQKPSHEYKPEVTTASYYEKPSHGHDVHKPINHNQKPTNNHYEKPIHGHEEQKPSHYDHKPTNNHHGAPHVPQYEQKPSHYDHKPTNNHHGAPHVPEYEQKPSSSYPQQQYQRPSYGNSKYPKEGEEDEILEAKNVVPSTTAKPAPKEEVIQAKEDILMPTEATDEEMIAA